MLDSFLPEFLMLVTFCGNSGEPMDLSRMDGSLCREVDSRGSLTIHPSMITYTSTKALIE